MESEALKNKIYLSDDSYDSDVDIQEVLNRDKEVKLKKRNSNFVILISDSEDEENDPETDNKVVKVPGVLQIKYNLDSRLQPTEYLIREFKRLTNLDALIDSHLHKRGVNRPPNAELAYIKPVLTDPRYKLLYPATSLKYKSGAETKLNLLATHPLINSEEKYEKYKEFLTKHHLKECSIDMTKDNPVLDSVNAFKRQTNEHRLAKLRKHIDHKILSDYWKRHIGQKTYLLEDLDLEMFMELTNFGQVVDNYLKEYGDIIRDVYDVKIDYYFDILKKDPRNRNVHTWFRSLFPHPWVKIIWESITPHQEKFLCKSLSNFRSGSNIVELLREEHPDATEEMLKGMLKFQFYKYRTFPKNRKQGIFKYLEINNEVYKTGRISDPLIRKKDENIQARPKLTRREVKRPDDPGEGMKTETVTDKVESDNRNNLAPDPCDKEKPEVFPDTVESDNRPDPHGKQESEILPEIVESDNRNNFHPDPEGKNKSELLPETVENENRINELGAIEPISTQDLLLSTNSEEAKVTNLGMEMEPIETVEPEVPTPEEPLETKPIIDLTKIPKIVKLSPNSSSISTFRNRKSRRRTIKRNQTIRMLENIAEPYVNTESDEEFVPYRIKRPNRAEEQNLENSRDESTQTVNYPNAPGPSYMLLENELFNLFNDVLPDEKESNAPKPIPLHLDECHDMFCIDCNNLKREVSCNYVTPNQAIMKNEYQMLEKVPTQQQVEIVPAHQYEMMDYENLNDQEMMPNVAYIVTDSGELQQIDIETISNLVSFSNIPQPISLFEINQHNTYTLVNQPSTSSVENVSRTAFTQMNVNPSVIVTNLESTSVETPNVQVNHNELTFQNPIISDEWMAHCSNIVEKLKHNTNISSLVYHLKKMELGDENILMYWIQNGLGYIESYVMNEIIISQNFDGLEFKGKYSREDLLEDIEALFPDSDFTNISM